MAVFGTQHLANPVGHSLQPALVKLNRETAYNRIQPMNIFQLFGEWSVSNEWFEAQAPDLLNYLSFVEKSIWSDT